VFKLFTALYYVSDPFFALIGAFMIIIFIGYCCYKLSDGSGSSKTSYKPPRTYYSGRNYDDCEHSYNWDDSWDDKWLHQGKYADDNDSHDEYMDYGPSWDEHFRK
jgi:hypothetical protein